MERKQKNYAFVVEEQNYDGKGRYSKEIFQTLSEANSDAENRWNYMSYADRDMSHVWVSRIDKATGKISYEPDGFDSDD